MVTIRHNLIPIACALAVVASLLAVASPAGATPNLVAQSIYVQNPYSDYAPGDYIDIDAIVRNDGTYCEFFTVGIYLSSNHVITNLDQNLTTFAVYSLGLGESRQIRQLVRLPNSLPDGYYYVGLLVDPADTIIEWDELDNALAATPRIWVEDYYPVVTVHTFDYYYDGYWWSYDGYYYSGGYWYYYSGPYYETYYYHDHAHDVHYYCAAVPGSDTRVGWLLLILAMAGVFGTWRARSR